MNEKKYYKVLHSNSRTSCSIQSYMLRLEYKHNEWTKPIIPNSKLFVFKEEEDAKKFISQIFDGSELSVFPCHVKNPCNTINARLTSCCTSREATKFWDYIKENKLPDNKLPDNKLLEWNAIHNSLLYVCRLPIGTVLCDEVFCLV